MMPLSLRPNQLPEPGFLPGPRPTFGASFGKATLLAGSVALLLAGCTPTAGNFDWDLRNGTAGIDTTDAARTATAAPPRADARGVLSYPTYQVAVARRGDTVAIMAARIGLGADELARHNALRPEDPLRVGEVLALPRRVAEPAAPAAVIGTPAPGIAPLATGSIATTPLAQPARPAAAAPAASGPVPEGHRVARGETAYSIARLYNVTARALADWNGLGADLAVREGQFLIIPTAIAAAVPPDPTVVTAPGAGSPTPEPPSASEPLPDESPQRASEKPKDTPPSPDLGSERTAASAAAFAMPASGSITGIYQKKKNDGIDISAAAGSPVKAASGGTVAAITKDTDGTPIVVIRHADGLLTVYAGADALTVAKGDTVKRGQTIGEVSSGGSLHFEVRKGLDSVDPMTFLQ